MAEGLVAPAFALGGVLLASLLTHFRDQTSWKRQDATRWHEARLSAYTARLSACREVQRWSVPVGIASVHAVEQMASDEGYQRTEHDERSWEKWLAAHEVLKAQRATIELVGSPDVVAAAFDLEMALSAENKAFIEKLGSIPPREGGDVPIREVLRGNATLGPPTKPDPALKAAHDIALAQLTAAFTAFTLAAQVDLGSPPVR